jgi:NTP pyrophosphatase (non-canonical NTP hydrolase)
METTQSKVIYWAKDKGLINQSNITRQALKLTEEVGELASAIIKDKRDEQIDAIGDIQVVLIILCEQLNIDYNEALNSAYNVIKDRKGKLVNGSFIKQE